MYPRRSIRAPPMSALTLQATNQVRERRLFVIACSRSGTTSIAKWVVSGWFMFMRPARSKNAATTTGKELESARSTMKGTERSWVRTTPRTSPRRRDTAGPKRFPSTMDACMIA